MVVEGTRSRAATDDDADVGDAARARGRWWGLLFRRGTRLLVNVVR